jgi:N utilization substance protein B
VANPKVKRLARERAVQFLFGLEFTQYDWAAALDGFWEENNARPTVRQYADRLIQGVCDAREDLDAEIVASVENWTPDRVGRIEASIIRVALYEMRYMPDVPNSVAINEAIEVTKRFGAEEAPRFVNGVLDRLRRKIENTPATNPSA